MRAKQEERLGKLYEDLDYEGEGQDTGFVNWGCPIQISATSVWKQQLSTKNKVSAKKKKT